MSDFSLFHPAACLIQKGVQRVQSNLMEEGACLVLVSHPSSDGVTMKILYGVDDLLYRPALHPSFPTGLVKSESAFIVRSVECTLVIAVISADAYLFWLSQT